ncbi:unnamed protein product [Acanthoscelides obtectus]|uniref:BED-type domain-containing protein n=1 Tax=Acanthoscelides obtectus TaxID=200917 RepID=A0A9P0P7P2_ACAOB|nr:unnamed protein product [Acanthoscelides obtectus]CAK1640951.1 Zinc finger BED domain-containing protein 4 [Acanthoscelides obtectus]
MDPRKSSQAWLHFERIDDKPDSAKRKICGNVYKRGGGTKNLLDHLQRFHRVVLENGAIATRADGGPGFYEENSPKRKALDRHFLRMFAMDYQPFRVVEDDGFVQFVKALDPRYKLPCRQTISNKLLPGLYEESHKKESSGSKARGANYRCLDFHKSRPLLGGNRSLRQRG